MKSNMRAFLLLIGGLATMVAMSTAQSATTGQIAGVAKDPTGAFVGGAKVTLTSSAGIERETTTGSDGRFVYPLLPPGNYIVKIEASGFKPFTAQNVEVRITEYSEVDGNLALAGSSQTVAVSAAPPLVDTSTATTGRVIDEVAVSELPLPTRNYTQILGLSPGAGQNLARRSRFLRQRPARHQQ
jgi:hypothetical protein